MKLRDIAVLGGGPGGLYAARLLKLRNPGARVTLYEQVPPEKTFGFGVGLASRTQHNLRQADPESLDEIVAAAWPHDMAMQVPAGEARLSHGGLLAIARTTLLSILQRSAQRSGVDLVYGTRRSVEDIDADLVVAADGVNSATRSGLAEVFRPEITTGAGLYLWCGTDFALPTAMFRPATTAEGTFVAHAYPYAADRSTFLVETDEETWRRAGFDVTTDRTPASESDQTSLDHLTEAFADVLDGHRLIGNRTRWMRFRTVRCGRWGHGNVVLLGDAAHTAHYSIGSGTKLAMEDAIALSECIARSTTLDEALQGYEESRRGAVEHLQDIALRSEAWWDSFPDRVGMAPSQLMISYMTRAGKVSIERFATSAPDVTRTGLAEYAGVQADDVPTEDVADWALSRPLDRRGRTFAGRVAPQVLRDDPATQVREIALRSAWGAAADRFMDTIAGHDVLWLTGAADRDAVLTRLDVGERIRREHDALVVVEAGAAHENDLVAGLVSQRTDLVAIRGDSDSRGGRVGVPSAVA